MGMRILSLLLLLAVSSGHCAPSSGNLEHVLNAFLATFAKTNPAWMKEITILRGGARPNPGMQVGFSQVVGDFAFYPKDWNDLSASERVEVHSDRRLKSYLVSIRNSEIYPSITNAKPLEVLDQACSPGAVKLDGAEMLRTRPLLISVQ